MKFDPAIHHRRSIRLHGYDYSKKGAYFITTCTHHQECLFGEIVDGEMRLNDVGKIVADEWMKTATIRHEIELDNWMVMPNHFHAIFLITNSVSMSKGRGDRPVAPTGPQPRSVGAVIAGFKSAVTKRVNDLENTPGRKLWQRSYWEHIVRNETELHQLRKYVQNNPKQWFLDTLFIWGDSS
ncbi:transposase [Desulfatirhabdium butyrativorans]|uniref:transposase n=1 Tax=Desulfatirhabdium butyrativorans TaxID=340467 RepID=UPI0003FF0631|nr:transposase [Desulfatirhabdium butyrativorans]